MKVAVLGASGFLGRNFVKIYKDKFDKMIELNSKNAPLNDFNKLLNITRDIDILVHTAFDHSYKYNIIGIKNILEVCKKNKIKKLIYISSISVYDPNYQGILNENSPYSRLNDPYSSEKRKIENIIDNFDKSFDVIILQPAIVYGFGGNWTKYAFHACKSKVIHLPNEGNNICNAVYVDDVSKAVYLSCITNIKYDKFLISNDEELTWKEFYQKHCEILKKLRLPANCNIIESKSRNEFHSSNLINFIFYLWFKTLLGNIFNLTINTLKKLRAKNYHKLTSSLEYRKYLESNIRKNILEPIGITKKVHCSMFKIDISKAKMALNFTPEVNLANGMKLLSEDIKSVLR